MNFLPRRNRQKNAPRHALAAVRDAQAPETAVTAGPGDGPRETFNAAPAAAPDDTILFRIPAADGGPGFVIPPGNPWSTDQDTLLSVRDALQALPAEPRRDHEDGEDGEDGDAVTSRLRAAMAAPEPAAWLRAIMPGRRNPWDALPGRPSFAGVIADPDGLPYAGLYLGEADADGRMVIDVRDPQWLYDLIGAAYEALDALESGEGLEGGAAA